MSNASRISKICTFKPRGGTWFDKLTDDQKKLAKEVREEVIRQGLPMTPIAHNLIADLKVDVHAQTVARWFKEGTRE
jgi:hypothetical protein